MAREAPNPESRIEIGKRLKLLRDALDKTQLQMAHLAGLTTPNAWTNYENGSRRIGLDYAFKLKMRIGASISYIYHGDMSDLPADLAEKINALMAQAPRKAK
jgi:transcriptional regulator with XRE-family HTH domain